MLTAVNLKEESMTVSTDAGSKSHLKQSSWKRGEVTPV